MDTEVINQILQEQRETNLDLMNVVSKLRLEIKELKSQNEGLEKRLTKLEIQDYNRTGGK